MMCASVDIDKVDLDETTGHPGAGDEFFQRLSWYILLSPSTHR